LLIKKAFAKSFIKLKKLIYELFSAAFKKFQCGTTGQMKGRQWQAHF
jgi:hypothetical protein